MLPSSVSERKTLADLIFAKLDSGEISTTAAIQKVHQGGISPWKTETWTNITLQTVMRQILLLVSIRKL